MPPPKQMIAPTFWISTLRGLRNGLYFGGKVRFSHALVMTLLFRSGPIKDKITNVIKLTWEHARNLGFYVFLYKVVVYVFFRLRGARGVYDPFWGGLIAGYVAFKKKTNVNYQVILYLFARILAAGGHLFIEKKLIPDVKYYPIVAAACWGLVMLLFEDDASSLQPSLVSSMKFLYRDSNSYKSWVDFVPFYVPPSVVKAVNDFVSSKKKEVKSENKPSETKGKAYDNERLCLKDSVRD